MTTFDSTNHAPALSFDFTGFLRGDGTGNCTGRGEIPEPSAGAVREFLTEAGKINLRRPPGRTVGEANPFGPLESVRRRIETAIFVLGVGEVRAEELEQLPFRVLYSMFRWLAEELQVPALVGF